MGVHYKRTFFVGNTVASPVKRGTHAVVQGAGGPKPGSECDAAGTLGTEAAAGDAHCSLDWATSRGTALLLLLEKQNLYLNKKV